MSNRPEAVFLNVSPALEGFDRPLVLNLSRYCNVAKWQYFQTEDEPVSIETAIDFLHDYLSQLDYPVHLVGHSTGGLLGILYARRYPEKVRSLTTLSVGYHPGIDWQAHYYAQLQLLPCSRTVILAQTVNNLFGLQSPPVRKELVNLLERDLANSLSPHTLYRRRNFWVGGVPVPFMACGGQDDLIISNDLLSGWQTFLKQGDRYWECQQGRYFFHYQHPKKTSQKIVQFWNSLLHLYRENSERTIANTTG